MNNPRFIYAEIGSAKDNLKSPIHNWYKFTAGFSHKLVEELINFEGLKEKDESQIFDPFAGCGTTLVSSQKEGIRAVGNEGQEFMYDIIRAKLDWSISTDLQQTHLSEIARKVNGCKPEFPVSEFAHPLLATLYSKINLTELYLIKFAIEEIPLKKYRLFFRLALSQTLHKVSVYPIAIPYIVRTKKLTRDDSALDFFMKTCQGMNNDLQALSKKTTTSKIYKQDSRQKNNFIADNQCNLCITSPPYLNNLDYGEISKVHTHFFQMTDTWGDITEKIRKKLVTGSTTHYNESEFDLTTYTKSNFAIQNKNIIDDLLILSSSIRKKAKTKSGKKSFDILMLLYFKDMALVLSEIKRILKPGAPAYLVLGDSAPYGQFIPTTRLIAKIAKNTGFEKYRIHKIRSRGSKWKSLRFRHAEDLSENLLILK